jgi:hypothetical protein
MNTEPCIVMVRTPRVAITQDGLIEAAGPRWPLQKYWVQIDSQTGQIVSQNCPPDELSHLLKAARRYVAK